MSHLLTNGTYVSCSVWMSEHVQSEVSIGFAVCIYLIPQKEDCRLRALCSL